jgi:uncharacterized phage protein (TIGR01671 family)
MKQREIKFRAWDTIDSEWKYSGYPHMPMWKFWDSVELGGGYENVCQFTGLCDKNGKEIYEGDVVKNHTPGVWIVTWREDGYELLRSGYSEGGYKVLPWSKNEVIGNIYENPELLE